MSILMQRMMRRYMAPEGEGGSGGGGGPASAPPATAPAAASPASFSPEYVRELREENKGWRLKAQEQEGLAKTAKEAADKAKKEAEDSSKAAQSAADQRVIRAELKALAIKAGMIDMDGLKLADLSTVKLNEQGEVEGADALLEALKKAKPYLFGTPGNSSTPVVPPTKVPPGAKLAKDMTAEEYKAARKQLSRT